MEALETLNPAQRKAAEHMRGPLLIIAGAGAGKTKTVTYRIWNLVRNGIAPENILAVTFTNKAAREMRDRVTDLLGKDPATRTHAQQVPFVSTFHALGVRILKENAARLGLPKHFAIYDRSDSLRAIKNAIKDAGFDPKEVEPRKVLGAISWQKGSGVTRAQYAETAGASFFTQLAADAWDRYERTLRAEKALDFDDLLLSTKELLEKNEDVRTHYQTTWQYIHVDEYQDTNRVQDRIVELLAGDIQNVCVVGDTDQTVYSWRGADIRNILRFEKRFKNAETVFLEENYRSTQTILKAANAVIAKNVNRHEKNLFTNNALGEPIKFYGAAHAEDEARFIAQQIREQIHRGVSPSEIAVLYRANFQSRILEEHLLIADIPYQVVGVRFFERKEVKDVLSYIRLALNPEGVADLARVCVAPPRGIGKVALARIVAGEEEKLTPKQARALAALREVLAAIRADSTTKPAAETIKNVIVRSGLETHYTDGTEEGEERIANMQELVSLARAYDRVENPQEGIEQLLENAALATDQDSLMKETDAVKLMTVHAAKGLEFNTVFVTGLEEDLFPHAGHDEKIDSEEERRLFYVAITRARRELFLTSAAIRTIYGSTRVNVPSQFLSDIDTGLIEPIYAPETDAGGIIEA